MILGRTNSEAVPGVSAEQAQRTPGWVGWLAPLLALTVVGISTLTRPYGPTRNLIDEIVGFVVAVVTLALWEGQRAFAGPAGQARRSAALRCGGDGGHLRIGHLGQ